MQATRMVSRRLGRTGLEVSRLGFGAMRLPELPSGRPDWEESIRIIHEAFASGVTYIDTAIGYCHHESESVVGRAIKGWRERLCVSTKNHYMGPDEKTWWKNLENSLSRLDVAYIDIYNIHGIDWKSWEERVKGPNQVLAWMKKAHAQGLIRHICCSFHDNAEALEKIVDTGEFSSVTLQYNLLDRGLEGVFAKIAEKDIGIVAMGPVGGGRLGGESDALRKLIPGASSVPEAALRFIWANPYVTCALSGMSSMDQVRENCATAFRTDPPSEDERQAVVAALERYKGLADLYCTGCGYCMPCPQGVDIPGLFSTVNTDRVYGLSAHAEDRYKGLDGKPTYCTACGACEPKCPQKIPIRVQLREAAKRFDAAYGQMGVTFLPLQRKGDEVRFRAQWHNLSDRPNSAAVTISGEEGLTISPSRFDVKLDEAFASAGAPLVVRGVSARSRALSLEVDVSDAAGQRSMVHAFRIGECGQSDSLDALGGAEAGDALAIEQEDQVEDGKELLGSAFGLRARMGYAKDALLAATLVAHPKTAARLQLGVLLDLRDRTRALAPGFQKGVYWIRLAWKPGGSVEVSSVRGDVDAAAVEARYEETPEGSTVRWRLPWNALGGYEPAAGSAFGLDLMVSAAGADDRQLFRAAWSGNPRAQHDATGLGTVFFAK